MIGKLRGSFGGRGGDGSILIDVGGVSYAVHTTLAAVETLAAETQDIEVYTHMAVKEDAIELYAFPTQEELSFFRQLLSVSGIGPKTALGVLNLADVRTLKNTIASGDSSYLTRVFGLGKKSAERIVVELKDKLAKEGFGAGKTSEDGDVLDALLALGYSAEEARTAVKAAVGHGEASDRLRKALQILGS